MVSAMLLVEIATWSFFKNHLLNKFKIKVRGATVYDRKEQTLFCD